MSEYGLLGESLKHSFSPILHSKLNNSDYEIVEISKDNVDNYLKSAPFSGINVTIPYKQTAFKYCIASDNAKTIGAVNTLVKIDGQLYGYNTDYLGFTYLLKHEGIDVFGKKVVILGSGGTSRTVCFSVNMLGAASVVVLSRNSGSYEIENCNSVTFMSYEDKEQYSDADILINTTPVGMYPNNEDCPIDLEVFSNLSAVVDVIYNPLQTRLVLEAKKRGIVAVNGLLMLVAQGYFSERLFFGKDTAFDEEAKKTINEVTQSILFSKKNIVLIGMPGSGKTSVGKIISENLGREFYDSDQVFEDKFGISAGDCIVKYGEDDFRTKESEIIRELSQKSGVVISTGGGSVIKPCNVDYLRKNGTFVYLKRPIEKLSSEGRPLSGSIEAIKALFDKRKAIYEEVSDISVDVEDDVSKTVNKLMKEMRQNENPDN